MYIFQLKILLWLPLSFKVKNQGHTTGYEAIFMVSKPPHIYLSDFSSHLLTPLKPLWLPCSSSNILNSLLPQDTCTFFSLCLECSLPIPGIHMACSFTSLFSWINLYKVAHTHTHTHKTKAFSYFLFLALLFSIEPTISEYSYLFFCFYPVSH